jgi:hypothetical protein
MSRIGKSLAALLALGQLLCTAGTAVAADPAAAEVLFQEGRRLLAAGEVDAACEKLKESFNLDAMSGTLLNLAACYERAGRTATAWARFRNAASLAKSQGKTAQANEASRRIRALEAQLSYLRIEVPDPVPGLEVQRNDTEVTPAAFGVEVPVDPGRVEVVASAPGYEKFRQTVEVGIRRDKQVVTIPKLNPAGASEVAAAAAREAASTKNDDAPKKQTRPATASRKPAAEAQPAEEPEPLNDGPGAMPWVIGGFGLAAAATGGVFGYLAIKADKNANNICPTREHCAKGAFDEVDKRNRYATYADVGVGVGLVALTVATLWLSVGGSGERRVGSTKFVLQPAIAKDAAALWAVGKF